MKNISIKSLCFSMALLPLMLMLASCSGDDYLNAIPDDSTALVALDLQQLSADGKTDVLNGMLGVDDVDGCGIDLSSKLYVFTTAEGSVGLAAKVDDDGALDEWLGRMSQKGFCVQTSKRKDFGFTVIKDSWVAGFSSGALVVLGPVLPSQQADAQRRIIKYLEQDEEHSVKATPMFARLDTIGAPVALVAQAAALPEKSALRWEQTGSRKYRVSVEGRVIEKLEIWNPEGQKVCQLSPGAEVAQADLTALASGVYVIRITTDQGAAIVFKQTVR